MKRLISMMLALGLTACGPDGGESNNAVPKPGDAADSVRAKVEEEVSDSLDCSGVVREETRNLVTRAISDAEQFEDLVVAPEELARFVGAVVVSTDTTALLVGNVARIATLGHFPAALRGEWDELSCGEATVVPCVDELTEAEHGTATTSVVCEDGAPTAVRATFGEGCQLFVTENSGAVDLRRADGALAFDGFSIGSVRQLEGLLAVAVTDGVVKQVSVADDTGLSIASNAGKSCEERLTIRELVADLADDHTAIDIDAERLAGGETVSLLTPDAPAVWSKQGACTCPDPGSALEWGWKGFLKGEGDARLRLDYAEPKTDDSCASVTVDIMNWPEQCDGETTAGDCGKAAVEALLGPVFSAACVPR